MATMARFVLSLLAPLSLCTYAETAKPADMVANAVGVNTHFGDTDTPYYINSDLSMMLLRQLGARHFRDGISFLGTNQAFPSQSFAIFGQLGQSGIAGDYIMSCSDGVAANAQLVEQTNNVEAIEYPNEYDISGDAAWVSTLRTCGPQFSTALTAYPQLTFIGPSLVQMASPALLGPVPMAVNNLHAYINNYPPDLSYSNGYDPGPNAGGGPCLQNSAGQWDCFPGLRYQVDNVQSDGPGVPIWITETGYKTTGSPSTPGNGQYVPAQYGAAYYVREILWALNNNVDRVYFYALLDDPDAAFGLVTDKFQPKPAFYALSSLIGLMTDKGQPRTDDLPLTLTGGDQYLMHSVFERSDGTFYLVLWLRESDWDGAKDITPAPESVGSHTIMQAYTMQPTGMFSAAAVNQASPTVQVGTQPIFLKIQ